MSKFDSDYFLDYQLNLQIGASLMTYLLKGASIFLDFSGKKHYQVAGPPVTISKHSLSKRKRTAQFSDTGIQSGILSAARTDKGTSFRMHIYTRADNTLSLRKLSGMFLVSN